MMITSAATLLFAIAGFASLMTFLKTWHMYEADVRRLHRMRSTRFETAIHWKIAELEPIAKLNGWFRDADLPAARAEPAARWQRQSLAA